jgi:hypothetical protein
MAVSAGAGRSRSLLDHPRARRGNSPAVPAVRFRHDLAAAFGVTTVTLWNWQSRYPEFF